MTPPSPADPGPAWDTAVVGGGAAGLACATRLAELGRRVVLFEARATLGGRASSWTDRRVGAEIDNGPHLLAGAYRELFTLLRRVGAGERWDGPGRLRVPLWSAEPPARHVLRWRSGPGRLGLAWGFASFGALSSRARMRALSVVSAARAAEDLPDRPLSEFLSSLDQSAEARRWLWHPLARAVFNEVPGILSTRLFAGVLRRLFGEGPDAAALWRPTVGLSRLYAEPAAAFLSGRAGEVRHACAVESVRPMAGGFELETTHGRETARTLCLAVPAEPAARLLPAPVAARIPHLGEAARVAHAPLVTVHLWLEGDAPALSEPFVGLVDGEFAWAFDVGPGAVASGPVRHVALVAPGSRALADEQAHRLARLARTTLEAHAALVGRILVDARVIKEPRAAPSLTPEAARQRPAVETPVPGLTLAGDWTDTGLPATLEGAAWSGHRAAGTLDRYLAGAGAC